MLSIAAVKDQLRQSALAVGGDPYLALATVDVEDPAFDVNAVGDLGTAYPSYGLFQERIVVGRGGLTTPDTNPTNQVARFFADVRAALSAGFTGTPGQLAAAVQRPGDPAGYATKVDAAYAVESSAPVTTIGGAAGAPPNCGLDSLSLLVIRDRLKAGDSPATIAADLTARLGRPISVECVGASQVPSNLPWGAGGPGPDLTGGLGGIAGAIAGVSSGLLVGVAIVGIALVGLSQMREG